MNLNSFNLATRVLDIMGDLPPTNPLSLSNAHYTTNNPLPDPTDSKSIELPPIYGEKIDANWIESHNRLLNKLTEVREQLLDFVSSSTKVEERPLETPFEELPTLLVSIQQRVENVRNFVLQMRDIEQASIDIEQATGRLTSSTMNGEIPEHRPLGVIQEVLTSILGACKN